MASSELEIEPDLNKAPPHVEGDLLKQGTQSLFGHKSWKKFFFIVLKDRLQYFDKRDDSKQNKEPVAYIRMSQVTSITEVVFTGVPKKHHLNCGFTLEAFHPVSQQKVMLNLLAETPEDMRYWVFALRYIKAYYSKMLVRETVLNEETERRILEKLLSGGDAMGEDDEELILGKYSLDEDAGATAGDDNSGASVSVFFSDGSKVKVHMKSTDTTSDLLDREEVKKHLTSSAAHIWLVDSLGNDMILKPDDHPALFPGKMQKLFALDHSHRVLPVFYSKKEFECIVVTPTTTASKIIEHHDLSVQLDLNGITNHGLFLKSETEELMFDGSECPCDLLYDVDVYGSPLRQPVGKLLVRNKSLGGGRSTFNMTRKLKKPRATIYKPQFRSTSEEQRIMEGISEEERAQSKALDLLHSKKKTQPIAIIEGPTLSKGSPSMLRPISQMEVEIDGEQWIVANESKCSPSASPSTERHTMDGRGLEEAVVLGQGSNGTPQTLRKSTAPGSMEKRKRSAAISDSSVKMRSQTTGDAGGKLGPKEGGSPLMSPPNGSPHRSRSRSPGRKLPEVPMSGRASPSTDSESLTPSSSPFQRRNATRADSVKRPHSSPIGSRSSSLKSNPVMANKPTPVSNLTSISPSSSFTSLTGKGPMIRFSRQDSPTPSPGPTSPISTSPSVREGGVLKVGRRSRSPTVRGTFVESLSANKSRSSMFGLSHSSSTAPAESHSPSALLAVGEESDHQTLLTIPTTSESNSISPHEPPLDKYGNTPASQMPSENPPEILRPFVIDFKALQVPPQPLTSATATEGKRVESAPASSEGKPLPINVTSPNLLKVILLQSSEAHEVTSSTQPLDFISLSGVALINQRGVWSIQDGYYFHDELPKDCDDHTETFKLCGGIRTIYNHTHKRWHVLPPSSGSIPSRDNSHTEMDNTEHAQDDKVERAMEVANTLYLSKKVLVTEVGSAFHAIMELFGQTRDMASKKRIGSDMTNPAMGHLIRGRFCSSLARLMLDGLRPYRLQGIVQDDIWKVTVAFCNAASTDPTSSLVSPSVDKLIFQPISALKASMKDNNVKFRTFISLAMSKGMLTGWLEALPKQTSVLHKYYLPSAFLVMVSGNESYQHLYQEILLTLEPMIYLPFDLSIDFESRQMLSAGGVSKSEQSSMSLVHVSVDSAAPAEGSPSTDSSSSILSVEQSPSQSLRPNVVIKTHAATGQRTTSGNILNAVWDTSPITSPSHSPTPSSPVQRNHVPVNETDGTHAPPQTSRDSAEEERRGQESDGKGSALPRQMSLEQLQPAAIKGTFKKFGGSLMKKFSDGFQHLNKGGAITGAPGRGNQSNGDNYTPKPVTMPPPPPMPTTGERVVEALYTNICDDADELCFNKGDRLIVKEQINEEWLICSHGNKTGIVPVNYITIVS